MSYITFKYPFEVNSTKNSPFSNTYTNVPAQVVHLHNFGNNAEFECYLNIKLQVSQ